LVFQFSSIIISSAAMLESYFLNGALWVEPFRVAFTQIPSLDLRMRMPS
jgi:hypothetical protein